MVEAEAKEEEKKREPLKNKGREEEEEEEEAVEASAAAAAPGQEDLAASGGGRRDGPPARERPPLAQTRRRAGGQQKTTVCQRAPSDLRAPRRGRDGPGTASPRWLCRLCLSWRRPSAPLPLLARLYPPGPFSRAPFPPLAGHPRHVCTRSAPRRPLFTLSLAILSFDACRVFYGSSKITPSLQRSLGLGAEDCRAEGYPSPPPGSSFSASAASQMLHGSTAGKTRDAVWVLVLIVACFSFHDLLFMRSIYRSEHGKAVCALQAWSVISISSVSL